MFINHLKESPPCNDCKTLIFVLSVTFQDIRCYYRNLVAKIDGTLYTNTLILLLDFTLTN